LHHEVDLVVRDGGLRIARGRGGAVGLQQRVDRDQVLVAAAGQLRVVVPVEGDVELRLSVVAARPDERLRVRVRARVRVRVRARFRVRARVRVRARARVSALDKSSLRRSKTTPTAPALTRPKRHIRLPPGGGSETEVRNGPEFSWCTNLSQSSFFTVFTHTSWLAKSDRT